MKKRIYIKPLSYVIVLHGPTLMISGSDTVNKYKQGDDIIIGDEDEPTNTAKKYIEGGIWECELAHLVSFSNLFNQFPKKGNSLNE